MSLRRVPLFDDQQALASHKILDPDELLRLPPIAKNLPGTANPTTRICFKRRGQRPPKKLHDGLIAPLQYLPNFTKTPLKK